MPLLIIVSFIVYYKKYHDFLSSIHAIIIGFLKGSLPNGGWSIVVEFQFYLLLPIIFFIRRKLGLSIIYLLIGSILIRLCIYEYTGTVQKFSYWTIIGRIDQFILGMSAYYSRYFLKNHFLFLFACVSFLIYFYCFDMNGGFYNNGGYPSPSCIWIFMPTVEGIFYGIAIAWYDNSFKHSENLLSRFLAMVGTCSYSIYLLHFFIVFKLSRFIDSYVVPLSNLNISLVFAVPTFLLIIPFAFISFKFIESPFLRFRKNYIIEEKSVQQVGSADSLPARR